MPQPKFNITFNTHEVISYFSQKQKSLDKFLTDLSLSVAKEITIDLQKTIYRKDLIWRGDLYHSIRAKLIGKFVSVVMMKKYGLAVDSMPVHNVYLGSKVRSKIGKWAMDPNKLGLSEEELNISIRVSPHPFINESVNGTKKRLNKICQGPLKKFVKMKIV